jgi:hypothetical protein
MRQCDALGRLPNPQWEFVDLGDGYHRIVNRTNGMVADSRGDAANNTPARPAPWNAGHNQQLADRQDRQCPLSGHQPGHRYGIGWSG